MELLQGKNLILWTYTKHVISLQIYWWCCLEQVIVPLGKIGTVNPVTMKDNPSEKYIQIVTVDGHDFWFMGFVNYDKASKNLSEGISNFVVSGIAVKPVDEGQKSDYHCWILHFPEEFLACVPLCLSLAWKSTDTHFSNFFFLFDNKHWFIDCKLFWIRMCLYCHAYFSFSFKIVCWTAGNAGKSKSDN